LRFFKLNLYLIWIFFTFSSKFHGKLWKKSENFTTQRRHVILSMKDKKLKNHLYIVANWEHTKWRILKLKYVAIFSRLIFKCHKVATLNCDMFAKPTCIDSHLKCATFVHENLGLILDMESKNCNFKEFGISFNLL